MHQNHEPLIPFKFQAMIRAVLRSLLLLLVLGALATLLFGSYWLLRDTSLAVPSLFKPVQSRRALIDMDGYRMVQSENGRAAWSVTARTAQLFDSREALLRDLEIILFYPDGRTAALLAEEGSMNTVSGDASVRRGAQDVRIVTSDGYLMTTDSLLWKAAERVVRTASSFRVLGKEIFLEGTGMTADVDLHKLVVERNVKAILQE
jgi:LPS export ABC transporter protein LptC